MPSPPQQWLQVADVGYDTSDEVSDTFYMVTSFCRRTSVDTFFAPPPSACDLTRFYVHANGGMVDLHVTLSTILQFVTFRVLLPCIFALTFLPAPIFSSSLFFFLPSPEVVDRRRPTHSGNLCGQHTYRQHKRGSSNCCL